MGDRRNSIGYNSSGGFGSSNRSCYGRSPNESFGTDRSQSRHGHHPYAGNDRSDHRRQSLPGGYGNHRGGYESRRSNGYEGHRGRGNGYNAPGRGGYRGSNRGRGGGPGTGRARDDDSKTEPLSSFESSIIPLDDMRRCPFAYKKEMTARINGYEITTKNAKVVYQYCIEWSGITKKGNTVNLNTQTKAAHKLQLKQVALFTVFEQLLNANKNFFDVDEDTSKYVYDTGSIFFAHQKFLEKGETREFTIDVDDFSQEAKDYYKDLQSASAVISFSAEINLNSLNGDLTNDRPILQYLEIAFSQDSRKFGKFFCFNNEFFEKESAEEIEGVPYVVLKNGCVRSIRLIGNPAVDKDKKLLIHLIPKKTAFYGTTSLPDFIEQTIRRRIDDVWQGSNLNTANEAIKNLTLCTTHMNHNRTFVTSGLSNDSAREHTFEVEGEILSVAEYFLRKHNKRLRYPDLPCVVERGINYYPLEVLRIADVQKIPKAKQNKFLTSKITNKCSFDPAKNIKAIEDQSDKAEIRMSNAYIKNTGCRVDARRLRTVPAKQLYPPCIVLKDTQKILNSGLFGMQTGDKFVKPARIRLMACILASRNVGKASVEHFLNEFLNRLKLYGVEIENHQFFEWQHGGYDCEKLNDLVEKGFEYVLAIGEDDDLHHGMKFMELRTRLITQHVMPRTVENANNTLYDNLAFKFNLRAGGINWTLSSDPELIKRCGNVDILKSLMFNTMFFGIDMTHPFGTNEPTSVGFASNLDSTTACNMGDFGYLSARETIIKPSLLASKFTAAIKAYYVKSGKYPSWIVVYRAGLSEGEIEKIQQYEIPVLKNAIAELQKSVSSFDKTQIKLTFIMSNENTNYRLFKDVIDENDKAPLQNLPPGTCVSDGIVFQKNTPSFILISQRPLKGTAHPMVYYVLDGADVVPLDHLQYLTYCLCYSNTINSPTSMCCPLESASDLSKRAKNNLNQWKRQMDHDGGKNSGAHNFSWSKENGEKNPQEDEYLDVINEQLKAVILEERFWA